MYILVYIYILTIFLPQKHFHYTIRISRCISFGCSPMSRFACVCLCVRARIFPHPMSLGSIYYIALAYSTLSNTYIYIYPYGVCGCVVLCACVWDILSTYFVFRSPKYQGKTVSVPDDVVRVNKKKREETPMCVRHCTECASKQQISHSAFGVFTSSSRSMKNERAHTHTQNMLMNSICDFKACVYVHLQYQSF